LECCGVVVCLSEQSLHHDWYYEADTGLVQYWCLFLVRILAIINTSRNEVWRDLTLSRYRFSKSIESWFREVNCLTTSSDSLGVNLASVSLECASLRAYQQS
jgi:hypothetical protein